MVGEPFEANEAPERTKDTGKRSNTKARACVVENEDDKLRRKHTIQLVENLQYDQFLVKVRDRFSQYLPDRLADELLDDLPL